VLIYKVKIWSFWAPNVYKVYKFLYKVFYEALLVISKARLTVGGQQIDLHVEDNGYLYRDSNSTWRLR